MRWLARRPSANASPPQADLAGAGPCDADDAPPDTGELLAAAERFITQFHDENRRAAGAFADRMRQVHDEVRSRGTYRHTPEELAFAARVAWRNSSRCIGRMYWRTLRVRDRLPGGPAGQNAAQSVAHVRV